MAVMTLESVVLRVVGVAREVVTGMKRIGSNQASDQAPARLSHRRHLVPSWLRPGYGPGLRRPFAEFLGEDRASGRAGRPGSVAGVPVRRSPAPCAGRTVPCGRPAVSEGSRLTALRWFGLLQAKAVTLPGGIPSGRFPASGISAFSLRQADAEQPNAPRGNGDRLMPTRGTPAASTRGKGV
jgi:hypothetical protein